MGSWYAAAVLLLAARAGAAADISLPDFIPPDTRIVMGIRLRGIVDSLPPQSLAAASHIQSSVLLARTPFAGLDPLKDIDEVLLATSGEGENPPALIVVRGRFPMDRLAAGAKRYRGVPLLGSGPNSTALIALLDASTVIGGDPTRVRAALDRRGARAPAGPAWAARIEPLRNRYDVWGIGERLEHTLSRPLPAASGAGFDSIDRFEFGAAIRHGLELTAEIHVCSPGDAQKLASSLQMLETMIKAAPVSGTAPGPLFSLQVEGGTLKLSVAVPEEQLKQAMESQRAAIQSALLSQLLGGTAPQPASRPGAPSETTVVTTERGDTLVVTLPGKR